MSSLPLTLFAFVVALGVLIAVHEFGHYRVAVACGVQVLRFSVGFGKTLWRWQPKGSATEFVIGLFPIGGYVRMLDEREAPVPPELRHLAFNNQPLAARAAIVAAGPLVNLLLAVLLYALVNWSGVQQPRAILASPVPASIAEKAGIAGGELVRMIAMEGGSALVVHSFDDLRWRLAQAALQGQDVTLVLGPGDRAATREVLLPLAQMGVRDVDASLFRLIGITGPMTQPVIGELIVGGAAAKAGLREGDRILRMGDTVIVDGQQLREVIRASVQGDHAVASQWKFLRGIPRMEILYHSIHYIDLLRACFGEPTEVWADARPDARFEGYADTRTMALLCFKGGIRATILTSHGHEFADLAKSSHVLVEGTHGAALATMGVNLDYPRGKPDTLELCAPLLLCGPLFSPRRTRPTVGARACPSATERRPPPSG